MPKLLERDRNAATVFLALQWIAVGSRQVNTTRATIRGVSGLCDKLITAAIATLREGRWLKRGYGRQGKRRWYRIVLAVSSGFPTGQKMTRRGRSEPVPLRDRKGPIGKAADGQKMTRRGVRPYGAENDPVSLEREGASYGPAPSLDARGGAAALLQPKPDEWEARKLAEVRERREAIQRGEIQPTDADRIEWLPDEEPAGDDRPSPKGDTIGSGEFANWTREGALMQLKSRASRTDIPAMKAGFLRQAANIGAGGDGDIPDQLEREAIEAVEAKTGLTDG